MLLVIFVWCRGDCLHLGRIFPEHMACDITGGVTKKQRNLFLFATIDGQSKNMLTNKWCKIARVVVVLLQTAILQTLLFFCNIYIL